MAVYTAYSMFYGCRDDKMDKNPLFFKKKSHKKFIAFSIKTLKYLESAELASLKQSSTFFQIF